MFGSKTDKTKSGGSGFIAPPAGTDDNFDINNLKETIKFLEADLVDCDVWISSYLDKKSKTKNLKLIASLNTMISHELKGKHDTNIQLQYYKQELQEEINKEK